MTGLIVPTAGSDGGRAANVTPREAPQTGAMLAQLGQQMESVGLNLENDYLDRQAKRFQVDLTRDMNNLRLEVDQVGDPDAAEAMWMARSNELRQSFLQGQTEDGRPKVHKRNAERFGLAFDEMHNRFSTAVARQTLAGRQSQREATYIEYAHEATRAAATADPDTRAVLTAEGIDHIDSLVANNVIDAAEGARRKAALYGDIDNARAIEMVASDPVGFLQASDGEDFGGLSGDVLARYRVRAQANIDSEQAALLRAAGVEAKKRAKVTADRLADIRDVVGEGMQTTDMAWLASDEAKTAPDYAETMASISLSDDNPGMAQMTPAQFDALIAGEKARPVTFKYQTERYQRAAELKADAEAAWAKDEIAYAQEIGIYVPELPEFDPDNPVEFGRALQARVEHGQEMVDAGHISTGRALSDVERDALEVLAKPDQDPKSRLALVKSLALGYGDTARTHAEGINDDPVFGWAVSLTTQGVPDRTVRMILSGQTKLSNKTVSAPSRAQAIELFHEQTGNDFQDQPQLTNAVLGAALAIYAEENPIEDTGELDDEKFKQAIQIAMGATRGGDQKLSRGGIMEIDGPVDYQLPLPANMDHASVLAGLAAVRAELDNTVRNRGGAGSDPTKYGELVAKGRSFGLLTGASLTGVAPDFGDPAESTYSPDGRWDDLQLEPLWPDGQPADRYVLFEIRNGRKVYLEGTDGNTFQLSLKQLIAGAAQ